MLDLRGLTFMDVLGTDAIHRVVKLTGVEETLVLVDDPDELVPPPVN